MLFSLGNGTLPSSLLHDDRFLKIFLIFPLRRIRTHSDLNNSPKPLVAAGHYSYAASQVV